MTLAEASTAKLDRICKIESKIGHILKFRIDREALWEKVFCVRYRIHIDS